MRQTVVFVARPCQAISRLTSSRRASEAVSLRAIGGTSLVATVLQAAGALWIIALPLRALRHRFAYGAAGAWVLLLWLPMGVQVVRRLYYGVTIGMEPADGMGSPLAFLIGFVFEWLVFLPLTVMLVFLMRAKPWRGRTVGTA